MACEEWGLSNIKKERKEKNPRGELHSSVCIIVKLYKKLNVFAAVVLAPAPSHSYLKQESRKTHYIRFFGWVGGSLLA